MKMTSIKIDTIKLSSEISKLKDAKKTLDELFGIIKKDNQLLRELWETRTSQKVFDSFEDFYKNLETSINNLNHDIEFLENKVNSNYEEKDDHTDYLVDERIAM